MNLDELKKEEVKQPDTGDTLAPNEEVAGQEVAEPKPVELNSNAEPTEEQAEKAEPEVEPEHCCEEEAGEGESCEDCHGGSLISEPVAEPVTTEEQKAVEKMLTQSQVNELIGQTRVDTRDKTLKSVYDRYGVDSENGMDEMVGRAQKYEMLHDDYEKTLNELNEAKIRLAMYDSGIAPERYEDARLILQGKGLDVTSENIVKELETHPEWRKNFKPSMEVAEEVDKVFKPVETNPASEIVRLGNERPEAQSGSSERDIAMSLFR